MRKSIAPQQPAICGVCAGAGAPSFEKGPLRLPLHGALVGNALHQIVLAVEEQQQRGHHIDGGDGKGQAHAFLIFYFRQNTKMFQQELLEAGRIDGLSEIGLFFRIYMPTMKNTYAAAAIITFMNAWNNYLWPLVTLQTNEMRTVPLLLSNLGSSYAPDYGLMMIAILIATIPTLIIFFVLQKYFVAGMLGAVK